jgi:hypothetical protein
MPSRKKKKPSFEVPEDVRNAGQAEWVYRSDSKPPDVARPAAPAVETVNAPVFDIPVSRTAEVKKRPGARRSAGGQSERSQSHSGQKEKNSGILNLTTKTFSSGFSTLANATLLGSRIALAPFRFGARMIGRITS